MKKLIMLFVILMMAVCSYAVQTTVELNIDFEYETDDTEVELHITRNGETEIIITSDKYHTYQADLAKGSHLVNAYKDGYAMGGNTVYVPESAIDGLKINLIVTMRRMINFTATVTNECGNTPYPCSIDFWVGDIWMGHIAAPDIDGLFWFPLTQQLPKYGIYTYTVTAYGYPTIGPVELKTDFIEDIHIDFAVSNVAAEDDIINVTNLLSNYPNPFNPTTTISFSIAQGKTGILEIFNAKGQKVHSAEFNSGHHDYTWSADKQASGVYFYRLQSANYVETSKMVLMK